MSGKQAKLARRDIRRASEAGLRAMQEQQENAIMAAVARCNQATVELDMLRAVVHNLIKRVDTLEAPKELAHAD